MATVTAPAELPATERHEKGLKAGALGLISSTVVGVASTAPAYSLAATLGFVVVAIGLQAPIVTIIAFIPMLFIAYAYKELNSADPDCGTTFTWGTRAFGPKTGWAGGWGIVAADILVMASLAQIAGQYVFLLFNANGIGSDAEQRMGAAGRHRLDRGHDPHLLRGHRGVRQFPEGAARASSSPCCSSSRSWALIKVGNGTAPIGHLTPSLSWFNPFKIPSASAFINGVLLMLFIYWGWDTTVSVNEETFEPEKTPGRAAVLSTLVLLVTYALVVLAVQSYAGIGTAGIGLGNPANQGDVLSASGIRCSARRLRQRPVPPAAAHGAELRRRLDSDHHPADGPNDAGHERLQGHPHFLQPHPPDGSSPRRCRRWSWGRCRSCST